MKKILFLLAISWLQHVYSEEYCFPPWERVSDDVCLLLKSEIKSWSHSKLLCSYYNGDLLYIDSADEQKTISDFFVSLQRYRFNLKPYIWLGATRSNDLWKWSADNETVDYNNWSQPMSKRRNFDCACIRVKTGEWKNCDCASTEHFVCRKKNPNLPVDQNEETNSESQISSDSSEEETTVAAAASKDDDKEIASNENEGVRENRQDRKSKKNSFKSENSEIATEKKKDNEKEKESLKGENIAIKTDNNEVAMPINKQFEEAKQDTNFIRDSSLFVNIYRTKIPKNSMQFLIFECPYGFGYYSTDSDDCTRYKICENWDNRYAIVALNQCVEGKIFSFKNFLCVDADKNSCDTRHFVPV